MKNSTKLRIYSIRKIAIPEEKRTKFTTKPYYIELSVVSVHAGYEDCVTGVTAKKVLFAGNSAHAFLFMQIDSAMTKLAAQEGSDIDWTAKPKDTAPDIARPDGVPEFIAGYIPNFKPVGKLIVRKGYNGGEDTTTDSIRLCVLGVPDRTDENKDRIPGWGETPESVFAEFEKSAKKMDGIRIITVASPMNASDGLDKLDEE